jgi:CRP-like cAMP-binding protein
MQVPASVVRRVGFLAELREDDLEALLASCRTVSYPKHSIVFHEGDSADALYIILRGAVKVILQGTRGQEITLNELADGEVLGEMALFDEAPRSATAVALQPTELLQIRREPFAALLEKRPAVAQELLRHAVTLLREANETIRSLSMFDVHGRIVRCLMKLARQRHGEAATQVRIQASSVEIEPRPSNQRLADMIGSSRETVSRAMKLLDQTGFIQIAGRRLVIKRPALRRYWPEG